MNFSESESETSVDSVPNNKKISDKKPLDKTTNSVAKLETKDVVNSESDIENKATLNVVRKLTRSSSTRKSKHLTGNNKLVCFTLSSNSQIYVSFSYIQSGQGVRF